MTRKEYNAFLRYKYKLIKKKTGNSQLAKRASQWGTTRIKTELGINIISPKQKKTERLNTLKNRYAIVRNATGNSQLAKKASQWSDERIEKVLGIRVKGRTNVKLIPIKVIRPFTSSGVEDVKYKPSPTEIHDHSISDITPLDYRHNNWAYWSKNNKFPKDIISQVYKINLENNLDVNDSYGYGIVYYSYIENRPINEVLNQYKNIDYGTGMILYTQSIPI